LTGSRFGETIGVYRMEPSDDTPPPAPRPRRPYVAPAIEESADFETLALSCTLDPGGCNPEPDDPDQQARS